jgi:polyhydroxybutyrate depolymerase
MKNHFTIIRFFLACFVISLSVQTFSYAQIDSSSFVYDGLTRNYIVFLPQNYQPNMPVVFNLHGYTDYAYWQMEYTAMNDVADTAGFIVVYPDAIPPGFNTGLIIPGWPPLPTYVDDVGFISALIDTLKARYDIDMKRVYSCGYSNGAIMTFKLACQLGHRFAAGASVSGVLIDPVASNVNLNHSFPILMCHGTDDQTINYNGGPEPMNWSVEQTLNFFIQNNNCLITPHTILIPDTCTTDYCIIQKTSYTDCADSVQVVLYKVIYGGHSWPQGTFTGPWAGNTNRDINANVELWNFFKNYQNPYAYIAYGKTIDVSPKYIPPQGDTLSVIATVRNDANHQVTIFGMIQGENSALMDSIQLYDDGLHGDENPNDNIWGAAKWFSGLAEDMYTTNLSTRDITEGTKHFLAYPTRFTTVGPVVYDSYEIPLHTPTLLQLKLSLKNNGSVATATNVSAEISTTDTNVTSILSNTQSIGDIPPGQIKASFSNYVIRTQNNPTSLEFTIRIFSDDMFFWSDSFTVIITGLTENETSIPTEYTLKQNYPNPFNPITNIEFSVPKASEVTLKVLNILGEQVEILVSDRLSAGSYSYEWDASKLASGLYLYRLQAGNFVKTRKMVLMK